MRVPLIVAMLMVSAPAASAPPVSSEPAFDTASATSAVVRSTPLKTDTCRSATAHVADGRAAWMAEPVKPKKLDELPPGEAYMAVYRTINGCEEPLTLVEYRNSAQR